MSTRLPAWFLAHGAPLHLLGDSPVRRFWRRLPQILPYRPRAILCQSAHWLEQAPTLSGLAPSAGIQHDFHGFPEALYRFRWALHDDPETDRWLSGRLAGLLPGLRIDPDRPLDHGVWVPLIEAWPGPDFPVYQLSLCTGKDARRQLKQAWTLGRQLAPLRDEGVLIIGRGGLVHNLRRLDWQARRGEPPAWAAAFMQAVKTAIAQRDFAALCDPWQLPYGRNCVLTVEHYLPLLVVLGTVGDEPVLPLYEDWEYGSLALHSYAACRSNQGVRIKGSEY